MMERNTVSDLELEKYLLQELGAARAAEIDRLKNEDPALAGRILALRASDQEILDAYPVRAFAARIREASAVADASKKTAGWKIALPALGAAAAAVAVTMLVLPGPGPIPTGGDTRPNIGLEITRLKGPAEPSLYVFRKSEGGEERLKPGQTAAAGDVIQLKYSAKGAPYGVIFSVDGRGTVTLHHPNSGASPSSLDGKGTHALDFSYELDDAPSYERFFFVTSNRPIDPDALMAEVRTANPGLDGDLSLDPLLSQCDFVLKKSR